MAKEYKLVELTKEEYENLKEIEEAKACQCCVAYKDDKLCRELGFDCFATMYCYFIEVKKDDKQTSKKDESPKNSKQIGVTKSGKKIYEDGSELKQDEDWTSKEHEEARDMHIKSHTKEDEENPESDKAYKIATFVQEHHDKSKAKSTSKKDDVKSETKVEKKETNKINIKFESDVPGDDSEKVYVGQIKNSLKNKTAEEIEIICTSLSISPLIKAIISLKI
jgi:hypothetical protein